MNISVRNLKGSTIKSIEIPESVFNVDFDSKIVNSVLRYGALSQRSCTASTKNRSAVAGSGKKRRAQKKSGRARMGERNPVHHRGGSVAFGPNGRQYDISINKKVRRLALKMVLSNKVANNDLVVVDQLMVDQCKTKEALKIKDIFSVAGRSVFIDSLAKIGNSHDDQALSQFWLSIRNVYDMDLESVNTMNLKQVMSCDKVFMTEGALNDLLAILGGE